MNVPAKIVIALIALLHTYIAWLEIFAWTTRGPSVFTSIPPELFEKTVSSAANQGIYNFFLVIGLVWSLLIKEDKWQRNVATCFLAFVFIAGMMAAATVGIRPGSFQMIPSAVGLALIYLIKPTRG